MSKYTTEVRYICENSAGLVNSEGYNSTNKILSNCVDKIFNFDYPIFDENYRRALNIKILRHYYTREIGFETVGLWKHFLETRLNEIMPYYNKLYETELLNFNPFYDVDLTTTRSTVGTNVGNENGTRSDNINESVTGSETRKDSGTITDSGTSSTTRTDNLSEQTIDGGSETDNGSDVKKNTRWDIYSDTPQGTLTNVDNENYLTNARKITDDGTGSTNTNTKTFGKTVNKTNTGTTGTSGTDSNTRTLGTESNVDNVNTVSGTNTGTSTKEHNINTTEDYIEHVKGKTPGVSYAKLLKEFRETFLNIDMMIINDLSDLFFNLW